MPKTILTGLLTCLLAVSTMAVSLDVAEAKKGRNKAFATGLALGILGYGAFNGDARAGGRCAPGPVRCRWVRDDCYRDRYGDLRCETRYRKCEREYYCD